MLFTPFSIEVIPGPGAVTVLPHGELDLATRDQLSQEVLRLQGAGADRVVVDLAETTFMDSSALGTVVRLADLAARDGFELSVRPGPAPVQRLFELSGLAGRLPFA